MALQTDWASVEQASSVMAALRPPGPPPDVPLATLCRAVDTLLPAQVRQGGVRLLHRRAGRGCEAQCVASPPLLLARPALLRCCCRLPRSWLWESGRRSTSLPPPSCTSLRPAPAAIRAPSTVCCTCGARCGAAGTCCGGWWLDASGWAGGSLGGGGPPLPSGKCACWAPLVGRSFGSARGAGAPTTSSWSWSAWSWSA